MRKLNQNIISTLEKYHSVQNSMVVLAQGLIFSLILIVARVYLISSPILSLLIMFFVPINLIVISQPENTLIKNLNCMELLYFTLHYLIPGKTARNSEVKSFIEMNENAKMLKYDNVKLFKDQKKFKDLNRNNVKQWVEKYIGRERSLLQLVMMRALGTEHLRSGILYWSQLIPREKLSIDSLRLILMNSRIWNVVDISDWWNINESDLNLAFGDYREEDLVRLFTSAYKLEHYSDILKIVVKYQLTLAVKKDMEELQVWAKEMEASITGDFFKFTRDKEWIGKLEAVDSDFGKIKLIDNYSSLHHWANQMRNCIVDRKQHIKEGSCYLFGIIRSDQPYMVLQVDKQGRFVEAKKRANALLNHDEQRELHKILNSLKS